MGEWLKVAFYAQLPDGMQVTEIDQRETAETLARAFGLTRVTRISVDQVSDSDRPTRALIDDRPTEGTPIWPSR